jgi:hypothetical protein
MGPSNRRALRPLTDGRRQDHEAHEPTLAGRTLRTPTSISVHEIVGSVFEHSGLTGNGDDRLGVVHDDRR